jgi:hypothetical protein
MDSMPSSAVLSTFPVTEDPVLDSVEPDDSRPGSFGIDDPGTFDPFKEIDDTTFEIYAMEGDTSLSIWFLSLLFLYGLCKINCSVHHVLP